MSLYIRRNGSEKTFTAQSIEQIQEFIDDGRLDSDDFISKTPDGPWRRLGKVDRLSFPELGSGEAEYDLPSRRLPPKRKKKKKKKNQESQEEATSLIMDENQYREEKRAMLDALPGLSHGADDLDNTKTLIFGAILYSIICALCCGPAAIIPMLFMGFRVYLVRSNTNALVIYIVAGLLASLLAFLGYNSVFLLV